MPLVPIHKDTGNGLMDFLRPLPEASLRLVVSTVSRDACDMRRMLGFYSTHGGTCPVVISNTQY